MTERAEVTSHWLRVIAGDLEGDAYPALLRAAADELDTLRAATTWRPLDTAPRDGTPILLGLAGYNACSGWWSAAHGLWVVAIGKAAPICLTMEPTAWMPLPEMPGSAP